MVRKICVLFIGTSATRGNAAQRLLADRGFDVRFDMPFAQNSQEVCLDVTPDLIAFDESDAAVASDGQLLTVNGRDVAREMSARVRVTELEQLPQAVVELVNGERAPEGGPDGQNAGAVHELRDLIAGLPGVVFRCSLEAKGRIDFISEQVTSLCGYGKAHFVSRQSRRLIAIVHPGDRHRVMSAVQKAQKDGRPFGIEHRVTCANGEEKWLWHRGCVHVDRRAYPELESFVVDITDRKREEQQLTYLASHDTLTGVANRGMFIEQMAKSLRRAERNGETIACLFLDLDRFKHVNDSFGHGFGDELLQQVAHRLRRCVRGNDLIGRFGGDEFTVLLDGIHDPQDSAIVSQKILDELAAPYTIRGRRIVLSVSIGISCYPIDAKDSSSLLRNADGAMYSVKSGGRCGYRFFSQEMSRHAFDTLAMTNGLRDAIRAGDITLSYQPRVELTTGRVYSFEALARWESREFGKVAPGRFIPLAEEAGLIGELGEHVLRVACAQLRAWDIASRTRTRVSVNISAHQFRDEHLVEQLEEVLRETGILPARLELEIAESTMMQDHVVATEMLHKLKRTGVKIAVDDFGTGYSSLHLLKKFPLDYLKVDSSFINGVPDDEDDVAITEAIIAMARRLNLGIVAEGIETEAQAIFVRSVGCDEGQGNLFSCPLPACDIREYLGRKIH